MVGRITPPAPRMSTSQPLEPVKVPPSVGKGILQCDYIKDLERGAYPGSLQ